MSSERNGEIRTGPPVADHERVLQAANQFLFDEHGEKKGKFYRDQNQFIIDGLEAENQANPGMVIAVALHDIVDHGLVNSKSVDQELRTRKFIGEQYNDVVDKETFIYGLGIAICGARVESEVAENWRTSAMNEVLGEGMSKIGEVERGILIGAISGNKAILSQMLREHGAETIKAVLQTYSKIGQLKTATLEAAAKCGDEEVHLLKGLESEYNIINPPDNNLPSTFRDGQEIQNCYGPMCFLMGFKKLAARIEGRASEFSYDDPDGLIRKQLELAEQYKDTIDGVVNSALFQAEGAPNVFRIIPMHNKSAGSGRKKLSDLEDVQEAKEEEKYSDAERLPDARRGRVIVDGNVTEEEIDNWAINVQKLILETKIPGFYVAAEHPVEGDPAFERVKKKNGYSATHVVFTAYTPDGPFSFEVQFSTEKQEKLHDIGKASALLRKAGIKDSDEQVLNVLAEIYGRARYMRDRDRPRTLNPNTWPQVIRYCPDLDTPLHKIFAAATSSDGKTALIPRDLAMLNLRPLLDYIDDDGSKLDTFFLPPNELSEENFFYLLDMLDPSLRSNPRLQKAVELAKAAPFPPRNNGDSTLECHVFPTAFFTGILASLSGELWENGSKAGEILADDIIAALLHDIVEDTRGLDEPITIEHINEEFGSVVGELVEALTPPTKEEVVDSFERNAISAAKVSKIKRALRIKNADKLQQHIYDIARWANDEDFSDLDEGHMFGVAKKNEVHFSQLFSDLPSVHKRAKKLVWELFRYIRSCD